MIPEAIVRNFAQKNRLPLPQAEKLFGRLASFLSRASVKKLRPPKDVDEAWHSFILHTEEYERYCLNHFGRFIHHVPDEEEFGEHGSGCLLEAKCSSDCTTR